jgi:hypothetical protein
MAKYVLLVAPTQFDIIPSSIAQLEIFTRGIADYSKQVCDLFPTDRVLAKFDRTISTSIQPVPP